MASIERTAYPRFTPAPSSKDLLTLYTPTEDEVQFTHQATRSPGHQVTCLVLLDDAKKSAKRDEQTGPSPVDRGKCGTALPLAYDARALPLGAIVTGANANDGCQTEAVLHARVVRPPAPEVPVPEVALQSLPRVQADGAYGRVLRENEPSGPAFACKPPAWAKPIPGWGRFATRWSAVTTSSPSLDMYSAGLTVRHVTT